MVEEWETYIFLLLDKEDYFHAYRFSFSFLLETKRKKRERRKERGDMQSGNKFRKTKIPLGKDRLLRNKIPYINSVCVYVCAHLSVCVYVFWPLTVALTVRELIS